METVMSYIKPELLILVAVLNLILVRSGRDEQALLTTLAGLIVVLMMLLQQISDLFDLVKRLFSL